MYFIVCIYDLIVAEGLRTPTHACVMNILYNYYSMQPGIRKVHLTARPKPRAQIDIRLTGPLMHYLDICLCKHVLLVEQSIFRTQMGGEHFFWVGGSLPFLLGKFIDIRVELLL